MFNSCSETCLVQRAQLGDKFAFAELFRKYCNKLVLYISSRKIPYNESEDFAQETFIRAYVNIHTLKKCCSFFAWIRAIATQIISQAKRTKQPVIYSIDPVDNTNEENLSITFIDQQKGPEQTTENNQLQQFLFEFIESLPEKQKLVYKLRNIDRFTYKELIEKTHMSLSAIKRNYARANKKFQGFLNQKGFEIYV